MVVKTIVVLIFFAILGSLASGLLFLVKDKGQSNRTVRALTVRIGLSIGLFLLLLILFASGAIAPHGVRP